MKRKSDSSPVNSRPLKQSAYTKPQERFIYDRHGFIQGGRVMRNPAFKAAVQSANQKKFAKEVKGVDFNTDIAVGSLVSTLNTNDNIFVANLVSPGTGSWNRVGRKIRMKSLRLKGVIANAFSPTASNGAQNQVRMVVVFDKQPSSGSIPTFDTIFGTTTQAGTEAGTSFLDSLKYDNTERFSVLKDQVFDSDNYPTTTPNTSVWNINYDVFIPLKGIESVYSGQSSPCTIADISSGAVYIIFRARNNNVTLGEANVRSSTCRLRYYDN